MKIKHNLLPVLVGIFTMGSLWMADAALVTTGFEVSEGFAIGSNSRATGTPAADWTLPTLSRGYVSDSDAFSGESSLAMVSGGSTTTAIRSYAASEPFTSASWSFTNPTATFSNGGNAAWIYLFVYDKTLGADRAIQFSARFGSTALAPTVLTYPTISISGTSTTHSYANSAGLLNDWSSWNTISVDFHFDAGTYDISLNGVTPPALSSLSLGNWDLQGIDKIWLVTPTSGITYYDNVTVVPEPSSMAMLLCASGCGLFAWRMRRRNALHQP